MKIITIAILLASYPIEAQTQLPLKHHISSGLDIRYSSQAQLCEAKAPELLSGRVLIQPQGPLVGRISQFMEVANQNVAKALNLGVNKPTSNTVQVELRLLYFRESNRLRNIPASLAGGTMVDPGEFRLDLAWIDRQSNTDIAVATFESVPSIPALFIGNSFSRQSVMRRNFRGQIKSLGKYWQSRQDACPASLLPQQPIQPIKN